MGRAVIAAVLLFFGSSASFVAGLSAFRVADPAAGGAVQIVPAAALLGLCGLLTYGAARLWEKWRLGLGACFLLQAAMAFQLSRQIPPAQETGTVARNYLIAAVLLGAVGLAAIGWHQRIFRRR
jgi:hypothetical protein